MTGEGFKLDDAFVAHLQELGILHDRNADGEYLYIYTKPFQDRFFFEFVQGIDGYDAYGASNGPVPIASHAQRGRMARG